MNELLLQIVLTIWIGAHPVTYTIPRLYSRTDNQCYEDAQAIEAKLMAHRRKKAFRVEAGCWAAAAREA